MTELEHSQVFRGGRTAPSRNFETERVRYAVVSLDGGRIAFRFDLASKGGGTTEVLFNVGIDDLRTILLEIAEKQPDKLDIFLECVAVASRKNRELLDKVTQTHSTAMNAVRTAIRELQPVERFVSNKYIAAPAGDDDAEAEAKDQIRRAMMMLSEVR